MKLVFQPGEEGRAGAYHMLKEGALDKFQGIFGLHVSPDLPIGTVGSRAGPFMAGSGRFLATIQGVGGHAAIPHKARDPVLAMSSAIISLQHIISRETDPLEPRVNLLLVLHHPFIVIENYIILLLITNTHTNREYFLSLYFYPTSVILHIP